MILGPYYLKLKLHFSKVNYLIFFIEVGIAIKDVFIRM